MLHASTPPSGATECSAPQRSRFHLLLVLVALVAFAVREHYVLMTIIDVPIRGDVREYVAYAWNLIHHGVFSSVIPQSAAPLPDGYRSPGYPWVLALCMKLFPQGDNWSTLAGWYPLALQVQVLMGAATVVVATLLAGKWLEPPWAILAGLLLALWPHHITASGALISEVLFGFLLILALYCFAQGWANNRRSWFIGAGLAFGYAYLTNPLIALFPACLAIAVWWLRRREAAAILMGVFLIPILGLALRNAQLPDRPVPGSGRAIMNFVQGSWPTYHSTHLRYMATRDAASATGMEAMGREMQALHDHPWEGLSMMVTRMARDPLHYVNWYAWRKAWLLWEWDIRIGAGGIYVYEVRNSPLEKSPVLHGVADTMRRVNPLLTMLTALGALAAGLFAWQREQWMPAAVTGGLAAYLTLIHVIFQAEPRYAIAYRGIEAVLAATALAIICQAWMDLHKRRRASHP